jgi:hypothetical protein
LKISGGNSKMKTISRNARNIFLVCMALIMVGCTAVPVNTPVPQAPAQQQAPVQAQPTVDVGALKTEVAQTVVAQIAAEEASQPTKTQIPTETPQPLLPVPTETPTIMIIPSSTSTVAASGGTGGSGGSSGGSGGVAKSATPTKLPYVDSAILVVQAPTDGTYMNATQDFDAVWTIKNTGRRPWTTDFYFKPDPDHTSQLKVKTAPVYLSSIVDQRSTYKFTVDMVAPKAPGTYRSWWVLVNDDGVAFFHFYIYINVR